MSIKALFNKYKMLSLLIATLIIWIFFHLLTEGHYLQPRNIANLFRQMAITGVLASGMMFVIINGEIDLSVGSLLGLLGGVGAILNVWLQLSLAPTIAIVIVLGILIGAFNGYWIAYRRIPSFIVTLSGYLAFRGIVLGLTKGQTIAPIDDSFSYLGNGYIPSIGGYIIATILIIAYIFSIYAERSNRIKYKLPVAPFRNDALKAIGTTIIVFGLIAIFNLQSGMPFPVLILLILLVGLTFIANKTILGRRIYSIGGNKEATKMSGINVDRFKLYVFMIMGAMAAIAGLLTTARLGSGDPSAGNMGELDAIASCFIGGASMRGGVGTISGALMGALIMASLDNGMSMMGIDTFWQMIVKGSVLLIAVWIDVLSSNKKEA